MPRPQWVWLLALWFVLAGLAEDVRADLRSVTAASAGPPMRPLTRLFTGKDGLPQVSAMSLATDRDGYLWVATQDGAAQFDGRTWKTFAMPNRQRSNFLRVCLATRDGRLWFGRQDGGLACRLLDGTWKNEDETTGLPAGRVNCLLEQTDGDLWIGTEHGLAVWQAATQQVKALPGLLSDKRALCLAQTSDGILWVGTPNGLIRYDGHTWENIKAGPAGSMSASYVDRTGALWVGNGNGQLWRWKDHTWQRWPLPTSSRITALTETTLPQGAHCLWVGTDGDGLLYFPSENPPDPAAVQVFDTAYGLPNVSVWSLLPLPSDIPSRHIGLWVGTDGGVLQVSFTGWATLDNIPTLAGASVYGMCAVQRPDQGTNYWFGTRGNGLVGYVDGRWQQLTAADGLSTNTVFSVHETFVAPTGRSLWIGTSSGLFRRQAGKRIAPVRAVPKLERASIRGFLESEDGAGRQGLWIVTAGAGLLRFEAEQWTVFDTTSGLPTDNLHAVCESLLPTGEKSLWVGTENGGLARLVNGQWQVWQAPFLPNNTVMTVEVMTFSDGRQFLFAGTEGGGLVTAELDGAPLRFQVWSETTTPGFPNDTVYQVRFDAQRRAYALTNKGVARLTYQGRSHFTIETFGAEDGLPSGEFNGGASMVDPLGRIWGGTPNGVTVFNPAAEVSAPPPQPPILQVTSAGPNPQAVTNGQMLPAQIRSLVFEISAPTFTAVSRLRYRTHLEGFDEQPGNWTSESRRTFTNLWPGEYVFTAWVRDGYGRESQPTRIHFRIATPWWLAWWAWVGYLGGGFGIVYAGVQWRLRALERRNLALEAKVAERTAALAAAKTEVEAQNQALAAAKAEVERKNAALDEKVAALEASQRRADRIFSALAEALPGTVLDGKYRLGKKLGAGGYGVVFAGEHLGLQRGVAVKVFKPVAGNDSAVALERFRREGLLVAQIRDPHVVEVLDAGVSGEGIAYLVMELLEGYALREEMQGSRMTVERALRVCGAVCRGLAAAHRVGVVHRDVKPENVYVDWSDRKKEMLKVVDFGIATMMKQVSEAGLETLTGTGSVVGTPAYIAPERVVDGEYDGRADVYAVGVMLYEMVCGKLPFGERGESGIRVLLAHVHEAPVEPRKLVVGLDEEVSSYMLQLLAKETAERPTAAEAAVELERLADKVTAATEAMAEKIVASGHPAVTTVTSFVPLPDATPAKTPSPLTAPIDGTDISDRTGSP
ncbi:MAG: protein kinase domain-containing protein [Acidobacteriota bacterium]